VPDALVGRTLAEAALTQRLGVRVIEMRRPTPAGNEWIVPDAATLLEARDELVVLGPTAAVDALAAGRLDLARPGGGDG